MINLDNIYDDKFNNSIFTKNRLFNLNETIINDNCKNLVLSELDILFKLLHNKLMKNNTTKNIIKRFNIVKKEVIYTYQWIIVYDFLYKLIDNNILDTIFESKEKYYDIDEINKLLPLEFILLLKCINNLLIPDTINLNKCNIVNEIDIYKYNYNLDEKIDLKYFFELDECIPPNYSKKINSNFIEDINYTYNIENDIIDNKHKYDCNKYESILLNDLMFCQYNELPCGQYIAHRLNINPIDKSLLKKNDINNSLCENDMLEETPLLIYVLKESEIFKRGKQLTGVGGIIIAEVILSILFNDKNSFFNDPNQWKPSIPSNIKNCVTMADIIRYVNE